MNNNQCNLGSASFAIPLSVEFTQTDTSSQIGADSNDRVYVFVYSPEAGAGIMGNAFARTDATGSVAIPDYWVGQRVHVYGFAIGGGEENKGISSDSIHMGSGTIS